MKCCIEKKCPDGGPGNSSTQRANNDSVVNFNKFPKPQQQIIKRCMACGGHFLTVETQVICKDCLHWSLIAAHLEGVSRLFEEVSA